MIIQQATYDHMRVDDSLRALDKYAMNMGVEWLSHHQRSTVDIYFIFKWIFKRFGRKHKFAEMENRIGTDLLYNRPGSRSENK